MRWRHGRRSSNVDDRRRSAAPRRLGAIGGGGLVVVLIAVLLGFDPSVVLGSMDGGGQTAVARDEAAEAELADFVSVVLADTEDTWRPLFADMGRRYEPPRLVLFRDAVESACGFAEAAVGPFYCPADRTIYVDLAFYEELRRRFGAPGDFAQAYVLAHEVGHHVQNLLGTSDRVHDARGRVTEAEYNDLSVRLELQADYFAGVWAHHAQRMRQVLETGDVDEALRAAAAIGDDRLQMQARGYVTPDSFTHGTSAQRRRWFLKGFETGDVTGGDTFRAEKL